VYNATALRMRDVASMSAAKVKVLLFIRFQYRYNVQDDNDENVTPKRTIART